MGRGRNGRALGNVVNLINLTASYQRPNNHPCQEDQRLDAPGVLHHVRFRGIERRKIFLDDGQNDANHNTSDNPSGCQRTRCPGAARMDRERDRLILMFVNYTTSPKAPVFYTQLLPPSGRAVNDTATMSASAEPLAGQALRADNWTIFVLILSGKQPARAYPWVSLPWDLSRGKERKARL
jgi:hypothetical protein